MASTKEAIAIVLDVGPGMNQAPPGEETALQTSVSIINRILQRKMFSRSKDELALVLFGTEDTANDLADGKNYQHVTLAKPLDLVRWELMEYVQNDIHPSNTSGDFLDALVVAVNHVVKTLENKKGFVSKRIVLFSNFCGEFADDNIDNIIASMIEVDVNLDIIGPDLQGSDEDDDDEESKDESNDQHRTTNGNAKIKTPWQRVGEKMARHLLEKLKGDNFSFSEVLQALSYFQSRQVRSAAWKCSLTIASDLQIPICLYIRIKGMKPESFKTVYAKNPDARIETARTFHLLDDAETEIDKSDVIDGYRYGSTLVPLSDTDKEVMKYKTKKCFTLLCFASAGSVPRHLLLGESTWFCVAEKGDEAAAVALSALVHAMYELDAVAIVRQVYQANAQVSIGCLSPHIKADYECLIYNELPFSEDIRQFTFGSLHADIENTGAKQKLTPTEAQLQLFDQLIDEMDLTTAIRDEDGETTEALKPKFVFNPYLQRLYQCLQHRALYPDESLPALSEAVASYLELPSSIKEQCQNTINKMKDNFKLNTVAKEKNDQTGENVFQTYKQEDKAQENKRKLEDDDIKGGLVDLFKVKEVGSATPVEDFKALLQRKDEDLFDFACDMMQKRITQLVSDSFGSQSYGKAIDCLNAYREAAIKNSEPNTFNDYIRKLREDLLNIGRADFVDRVIQEKLTLISKLECEGSTVTIEEASGFLQMKQDIKPEAQKPADDAVDDLLDDI